MAPSSLAAMPLAELQKLAVSSIPDKTSKPAKAWLDDARQYLAAAESAERAGHREETLVNYSKVLISYNNFVSHKGAAEARQEQRTQLVYSDFRSAYNHYVEKVQALKSELRERPVEHASSGPASPPKTDTAHMGSIADRMRALRGKGMEAESKRVSKDSSHAQPTTASPTVTSGAGTHGVARSNGHVQSQQQARNDMPPPPVPATAPASTPAPAPSTISSAPEPSQRYSGQPQAVKPTITGSSFHSARSEQSTHGSLRTAEGSYKSNPPTPILTPHLTAGSTHSTQSRPPSPPQSASSSSTFPNPHSPAFVASSTLPPLPKPKPSQYASPPVVGQHHNNAYHRTSPSLPSFTNSSRNQDTFPSPRRSPGELPLTDIAPLKEEDELASFASAFPSLSEFGKQFQEPGFAPTKATVDGLPLHNGSSQRAHPAIDEGDDDTTIAFPSVPSSLPSLPNAPTSLPTSKSGGSRALPQPPSKPLGDPPSRSQAEDFSTKTQPRRMFLPDGRLDPAIEREERDRYAQLGIPYTPMNLNGSRSTEQSPRDGPAELSPREEGSPSMTAPPLVPLAFPTPQIARPTVPTSKPTPAVNSGPKTPLPMSNAVEPSELRHYLMDNTLDILILDARSLEEFQEGHVGDDTLRGKSGRNQTVWIDPTVLAREGLTSSKLEDALSLSPAEQQKAFNDRHKFDLVVFYDHSSTTVPSKGHFPTAISVLFKVLYENEYSKTLQRSPVLLTGGYVGWKRMLRDREARRANAGTSSRPYNPKSMTNGAQVTSARPPSVGSKPLEVSTKRQNRDAAVYQQAPTTYAKNISESFHAYPQSMTGDRSYTGHHVASPPPRSHAASAPLRHPNGSSTSLSSYAPQSSYGSATAVAPPPQASINPGPMARRRSDYVEQHNQSYSGYSSPQAPTSKSSLDYPQAHPLTKIPQPPPAAASHALERHEPRGQIPRSQSIMSMDAMSVLPNGEDMKYWNDIALGLSGLKNLGNTCYMNSTLQCLSATFPFARFFLDGRYKRSINMNNPLGTKGNLANAFAELISALWQESYAFLSPITFRKSITRYAPQFSGTDQHDSQEFLSFVLDGLHEDLNRIQHKPPPVEMTPEREAALETLPPEVASEKEWKIYKMRNDSLIVDLFQGQYRNRLECLTCHKTSTTYDAFMYLALPVPMGKSKVVLQQLIDEFVKVEIMEGPEAWNCPRCKVPRRTSKTLTISRLPPVLLIQLKRFSTQNGVFWDKSETPVIFPVKGLDLTRYLPASLPVARSGHNGPELEDPRTQIGPFKYDLYGVSNHMGSLSSGHYTAFVNSSKGWMYCEDSKITKANERDVVSRPAYLLFYKRVRA